TSGGVDEGRDAMIMRVSRPPVSEMPMTDADSKYRGRIRANVSWSSHSNALAVSCGCDSQGSGKKYRRLSQQRPSDPQSDAPGSNAMFRKRLFHSSVQP